MPLAWRHRIGFFRVFKRMKRQVVYSKLFETTLGITDPWRVTGVDFDAAEKALTITVDLVAGSHFTAAGVAEGAPGSIWSPSAIGI